MKKKRKGGEPVGEMQWQDGDVLLPRQRLEEALGQELAKQYRLRRGEGCLYMPVCSADWYLCTCGTVNPIGQPCRNCGLEPELLNRQTVEDLRGEAAERLAREDAERARLEAQQREQETRLQKQRRRQKCRRLVTAIAGGIALVSLGLWAFWAITRVAIPASHYQDGLKALEKGKYQEAHRQFTLAGNYRDAEDYLARFYTPCLSVRNIRGYYTGLSQYEYDANGRLMQMSQVQLKMDAKGVEHQEGEPRRYNQLYDQQGSLLEKQDSFGKTVYTYNEKGDVVSEVRYGPEGEEDCNKSFVYSYDEQGRVSHRDEFCSNLISLSDSYEQMVYYEYDEDGRIAVQTEQTNYPASVESSYRSTIRWTYDSQGRPASAEETITSLFTSEETSREWSSWTYDDQGRQTEHRVVTAYITDPLRNSEFSHIHIYDRQGRLTEYRQEHVFPNDPARNATIRRVCSYDWEGRLVKEKETAEYADEERGFYSGYAWTVTYSYDLLGRKTKREESWEYGQEERNWVQTEIYHYGGNGIAERAEVLEKTMDGITERVVYYNDNGLEEKVKYKTNTDGSVNVYTYAYFYYPVGVERPDNESFLYLDGYIS